MRVTNSMMTSSLLTNISRNLNNLDTLYTQQASGKKIQMPSDNPIIATRALKFRTTVSETEQYGRNVDQANSWLEITESAFNNINSIMERMKELCVQGSNDSYTADDRSKMLAELSSLGDQLKSEMNVSYMGRYVFSGYKTDEPIVKGDTLNEAIYGSAPDYDQNLIDGQTLELEVGINIRIGINVLGTSFYTKEFHDNLNEYSQMMEDINNGTIGESYDLHSYFSDQIGILENFSKIVSETHAEVGVKMNRMELIGNRLEEDYTNYTSLLSKNEDIDLVEVVTRLNLADSTYKASLQAGMNITKLSLADYL